MTRQQELIKAWGHCNEDEFVALDFAMRWADSHPSEATIKKVIDLYKQWYSTQSDKPLTDYVQEHWVEGTTDTAQVAANSFTAMMGDPEQDLDDIINEVFGKTEQLKTKKL